MGQNKSSGAVSDSFSEYLEKASLSSREQDLYRPNTSDDVSSTTSFVEGDESDSSSTDDESEYLKDQLGEEDDSSAFTNPLHSTLSSSSTMMNSTRVPNSTPVFKSNNAKITFHIDHVTVRRKRRRLPTTACSPQPPNNENFPSSPSPQTSSPRAPQNIASQPSPSKQWYICEKYSELKKMDGKLGNVFLATQVAYKKSYHNGNYSQQQPSLQQQRPVADILTSPLLPNSFQSTSTCSCNNTDTADDKSMNFSRNHAILHPHHNRPVIIKFLKCSQQEWNGASSANSQYPLERYLNELKNYWYMTLNSISHGRSNDSSEDKKRDDFFFKIYVDRNFYNSPVPGNGHVFIMLVMPYFEHCLSSIISQYKRMDKTFSLLEIIQIFKQILRPILQLHQLGYGHHNLKPENVFIIPPYHTPHHHYYPSTPRNRPNKLRKQGLTKSNHSNESSPSSFQSSSSIPTYTPLSHIGQEYDIILTDPFPRMNILQRSNTSLMNMSAIRKSVASFNDLLLSDSLHYNNHRKSMMGLEPLSPHSILTPSPSSNSMSPTTQPPSSPSAYNINNPSIFNLTLSLTSTKSLNEFKPFPNRHAFEMKSLSEYLSPEFKELQSLNSGKKYVTIKQFSENLSTESGCEADMKSNYELLSTSIIGATDIFALGILFYQIMSLDLTLDSLVHASSNHSKRCFIRESIMMNYRQDVEFLDLYERLIDLITYQMLAVHPEERISPKNLFLHLDQIESFIKRRVMVIHWDLDKTTATSGTVGNAMMTNCTNVTPKTLLQKSTLSANSLTFNAEEAESIFYKLMVLQYAGGVKNALPELMKKLVCISLYSPLRGFQSPYQTTGSSDFKKTSSKNESISNMITLTSVGSEDSGKFSLTVAVDEIDHDDPFSILDHIDLQGFYHPEHDVKSLNQLGFSPEVFSMRGIGSCFGASKFKIEKFLECKRSKEVVLASKRSLRKNPIFNNTQQYRVTCIPIHSCMTLNATPRTLISIDPKLQVPFCEEYSSDVNKCISSHDSIDYYFNGYNIIETILNSYNYSQTLFPVIEKFSWVNMHCIVEPGNILNCTPLSQYLALKKESSSDITIDDLTPSYLSSSSMLLSTTQEHLHYLDEEEYVKLQIQSFVKPLPKTHSSPFTTLQVCNFALQLAESLNYFHQLDIVHCNINTETILFCEEKLVITGYDDSQVKGTKLGDHSFVAPEYFFALQNGQALMITDKLDIYQFGILLIELILGLELDSSISVLAITQNEERFVKELDFQFELRNIPKRISSLLKTCVCANPKKRMSSKEMLYELNEILKKK